MSHDLLAVKVTALLGSVEVIKRSLMAEAQVWTPLYLGEGCKLSAMLSKDLLLQFSYILLQHKSGFSSGKRKEIEPETVFLSICGNLRMSKMS